MSTVYVNGGFVPVEQATVSVLDRGFLFGDGVYEVIPAYGGCLFRLDQHLRRLGNSLEGIRLANPLTDDGWRVMLEDLVRHNGGGDLAVYLQVTRGVAARDHAFPEAVRPTVVAMCNPIKAAGDGGVAAITARDIRWDLCHIKAITLLPNALLRQQAVEAGAYEAILERDGLVTEGAASNVFVVRGDEVATPPKSAQLLPGITRDLVVELLRGAGRQCRERIVRFEELGFADEIWLTSSTREVVPVVKLDNMPVGDGVPGPRWREVRGLYQAFKEELKRHCKAEGGDHG